MPETRPLGLGLIGCGAFGLFCMETFAKLDSVRPAGMADIRKDLADAAAAKFGVPSFGDPGELIASEQVDLVHVATPPSSHCELVLAAANAGKHVLCEKPLAMTTAQADEMLAAAGRGGVICPVNFVLRYNAVTEGVKAIIDSGALGGVLSARLTNCASDTPLGPGHWFWNKGVSGGIFIEHGVHFFDMYSHWLGPGEVISAHTETREGTGQEDRVTCTVLHEASDGRPAAVASHCHGFDQVLMMDRTDHRLVCELGDIRVAGWIPLSLEVDAGVDDESAEALAACCTGADIEVVEQFPAEHHRVTGRGRPHSLTRRIRLRWRPNADKQAVYADSVRELLADQVAFIRDPAHQRRITEANGRDAVALAEAAVKLAQTQRA